MSINPFHYGLKQLATPTGNALWLYGEAGIANGDVYQPWKHYADVLQHNNCNVFSDIAKIQNSYDTVFVQCPKQQLQSDGLLALALVRSKGLVMAAASNDAGGKRLVSAMEKYGVSVEKASKSHFRIAWTTNPQNANYELIENSLSHLMPRRKEMGDAEWWTLPGLFSWDRIDPGSELLIKHLPNNIKGRIADFGCGYGYLSVMALKRYSNIEGIDAYDADARAIDCYKKNAGNKVQAFWEDIPSMQVQRKYDVVIMNPPFHAGKNTDITLGQKFIEKAWQSLKSQGRLFIVANQNLPYEKTVPGIKIIFEGAGYKIMAGQAG